MTFVLLAALVLVTWVEGGPEPLPVPQKSPDKPQFDQDWDENCDINTLQGVWKEPICDSRSL